MPVSKSSKEENFPRGGVKPYVAGKKPKLPHPKAEKDLFQTLSEEKKTKKRKAPQTAGKRKKQRTTFAKIGEQLQPDISRIEPVTSKSLVEGSLILGCLKEIHDFELVVSLPGSQTGIVPITNVSDAYTQLLQKLADQSEDIAEELHGLHGLFYVGQVLRCRVTQQGGSVKTGGGKRRNTATKLTINPSHVNNAVRASSIKPGMVLSGSIKSCEDHGFVVDLGIAGVTGFLKKNQSKHCLADDFGIGSYLQCYVATGDMLSLATGDSRTVNVDIAPDKIASSQITDAMEVNMSTLLPGMCVKGTVLKKSNDGACVRFLGYNGSVSRMHLVTNPHSMEKKQVLKLSVLHINPITKAVHLTELAHLNTPHTTKPQCFGDLNVGDIIEEAKILKVFPKLGVLIKISEGLNAIAFLRHLSDDADFNVCNAFTKGGVHRCRVMDFDFADKLVLVSLKKSVLSQQLMSYNDITPGAKITGEVRGIHPKGVSVSITNKVRGFLPNIQLADIPLKHPEKKFSEGDKVKCKVLKVDASEKKVILTHKRSLISSKLPVLVSYEQCEKEALFVGFIADIKQTGVLVVFYNDIKGWVPKGQLSDTFIENPHHFFYLGQVVKCRVLKCEGESLLLSFKLEGRKSFASNPVKLPSDFEIGKLVSCSVEKLAADSLQVKLIPSQLSAFIPKMHLSDHIGNCDALWDLHKSKKNIEGAMFFGSKPVITLSKKTSLITAAKEGTLVTNFTDLKPGQLLPGVVRKLMPYGAFVDMLNGLIGLAPNKYLCDRKITDPSTVVKEGQSVVAKVTEVDSEKQRCLVSLRMSDCYHGDTEMGMNLLQDWLTEYNMILSCMKDRKGHLKNLSQHSIGQCIRVKVTEVTDQGVLTETIDTKIKGFATHEHLQGVNAEKDKTLEGLVLYVDPVSGTLELTLSKDTLKAVKGLKDNKFSEARLGQEIKSEVLLIKPDFVLAILMAHASGRLTYLPAKRHPNDLLERHLYVIGQVNPVIIKRVGTDHILSGLKIHEFPLVTLAPVAGASHSTKVLGVGAITTAVIQKVLEHQLNIKIGFQPGRVHKSEILDNIVDGTNPLSNFKEGETIKVKVIGFRDQPSERNKGLSPKSTAKLECSLRPSIMKPEVGFEEREFNVGDKVIAFLTKITETFIWAEVTPNIKGKIQKVNVSTNPKVMAHCKRHFKEGSGYNARVTKKRKDGPLELSLIDPQVVQPGALLCGVVVSSRPERGVIVQLPQGHRGLVPLTHLTDSYTDYPALAHKEGDVLQCCVIACDEPDKCVLSTRKSRLGGKESIDDAEVTSITQLSVGQVLRGYIVNCTSSQGAFVSLGHGVVGRAVVSLLSDYYIKTPDMVFIPGMLVYVKVIRFKEDTSHIYLSMKESDTGKPEVIPAELKQNRRHNEEEKAKAKESTKPAVDDKASHQGKGKVSKRKKLEEGTKKDGPSVKKMRKSLDSQEESDSGVDVIEETEVKIVTTTPATQTTAPSIGFDWNATTFTLPSVVTPAANVSESDESAEESEAEDESKKPSQRKTKQQRSAEKKAREEAIRKVEAERLAGEGQPQSADEFDRLLLHSPNSSLVWMRYMAFHLQSSEIEKARAVANRALKTISFREEQEKLNIWVAYLNLENLYGSVEQLQGVFHRALQQAPQQTIYEQLASIYTRSNKTQAAEQLYTTMVKKFKYEKEVWISYGLFHFHAGQFEAAREIMQRSLKSVHKRHHVEILSKFAQMEFKYGEPERGKTMFEKLVSSYPRRTDLWSVYIDMLTKMADLDAVRELYERVTHMKMSVKRMKFLFKKYLEFEERHGDETKVTAVRQKALEYVESRTSAMDVDDDEIV